MPHQAVDAEDAALIIQRQSSYGTEFVQDAAQAALQLFPGPGVCRRTGDFLAQVL